MTGPRHPCPRDGYVHLTTALNAGVWQKATDPNVILINGDNGFIGVHRDCIDVEQLVEKER